MSLRDRLPLLRLNASPKTGLIPHFRMGSEIPKLIHQTYSTRALSPEFVRNIATLRLLNPGWTYNFYDGDDCIAFIRNEYGPDVLDYYLRIGKEYGAARADLFRYLALYRLGGVYLDMKSGGTRPFDEVLAPDDAYLLSQWHNEDGTTFAGWGVHDDLKAIPGGEFQQWFIITVPGHPFLRAVIENVLGNIDRYIPGLHRTGAHAVFRVTGPIAYSLAIAPLTRTTPFRLVDAEKDLGLIYSIFSHLGPQGHKHVFKSHYAELKTSLIKVGPVKEAIFAIYKAIARLYKALVR
ncbi:MAG TPA: glycosyltransferase [Magnetospirillaceae bacterium]|nr:glycosyltransferase [Magnetospirillaceae bacterium]